MAKSKSERLTPATSQARYPTLLDLRREGGLVFNGVAAAVLATGLAGCGRIEGGGTPDLGSPDRAIIIDGMSPLPPETDAGTRADVPGEAQPDAGSPDRTFIIIDGLPPLPPEPDAGTRDVPGDARPDAGSPDRTFIIDGLPYIPPDSRPDGQGKDALEDSADSGSDVK